MRRLLFSADQIHLSSPKIDGDKMLAPSQLIIKFDLNTVTNNRYNNHCINDFLTKNLYQECFEIFLDNYGSSLSNNDKVKGGSAVFKDQAICPFKAYANFRLGAGPLETTHLGLSPKLRGQILHQALELIWKTLQSQKNLLSLKFDS